MAKPSNPHSTVGENSEPSSLVAVEEEAEGDASGEKLPVLRWSKSFFDNILRDTQMPPEYGAIYPQEGETGADAPTGYVTLWADFFGFCHLRLSLTVFVVEVLEWFLLFRQRDGNPKLMAPPKGLTKWKTKFFYVKAAVITARLQFRNVTDSIITDNISLPRVDTVDWFSDLRVIGWVKLDNT
ncbi:hypothetical protein HanXRQr2_Chr11g0487231 [Helianthus annuus]|uniref:Uncharacterized protein n=1 Tax=Helianthus annuus TaxID=4232 RepID=A0A9K3MZQ8_HELAN|nr:hypothetical protein HanXRQr2_Chr11g0487231 [Helianthus annuus]KAJ0959196.1 hypothetical protein HanPSC8_Chr00c324g0807721 [Helianthus annuus]